MLGIILARNQETQGEVVGQPYNHAKLINKEQSQLSLAPSLLMLQVNQESHHWALNQGTQKVLQYNGH